MDSLLEEDPGFDYIVKKGTDCSIDSYSAFSNNANLTQTDLKNILENHQINQVFVVGLALDFCVKFTAIDAHYYGFNTFVVLDATKATNQQNEIQSILQLNKTGIKLINSTQLLSNGLVHIKPKINTLFFAGPILSISIIFLVLFFLLIIKSKSSYQQMEIY